MHTKVCVRALTHTHTRAHGAVQCVCVKYLLIHFGSSFFLSFFFTKMKKRKIEISLYSLWININRVSEWVVCVYKPMERTEAYPWARDGLLLLLLPYHLITHSHSLACTILFQKLKVGFFLPTPGTRIVSRDPCTAQHLFYFSLSLSRFVFFFSSSINVAQILHYMVFILCCALYTHTKTTAHPFQHDVCDAYMPEQNGWSITECIASIGPADGLSLRPLLIIIIIFFGHSILIRFLSLSLSPSLVAHCY